MKKWLVCLCVLILMLPLCASSNNSVPLGHDVYQVLEQAQIMGLCNPLPSVRPYSEKVVVAALREILAHDSLKGSERKTTEDLLARFDLKEGMDWSRGGSWSDSTTAKGNHMTIGVKATWESLFSGSCDIKSKTFDKGTDNWGTVILHGDMGSSFSWSFTGAGGMMYAPRKHLGTSRPYPHKEDPYEHDDYKQPNASYEVYSEPLAFFPYTYDKRWDSSVFKLKHLSSSGFYGWPDTLAFGYSILGEMNASFLEDKITFRFGRMLREWGTTSNGNSLALNANARPFVALESSFRPFSWLGFSALTGGLEYYNSIGSGIKECAENFQNMFSMALVELNYKNYFHMDFGSSCVWPKRLELGYIFPLDSNFFYQNNIGDFDNLAMTLHLTGTWPGVGKVWFSAFVDEFDLSTKPFFNLDRNMYALQGGIKLNVPWIPFSSFTIQYSKIEPYCYTHPKTETPWYGKNVFMETAYVNNGVGLGSYLPPNSDELRVKFDTVISSDLKAHVQYQMIRHGADFGSQRVDGSSLRSELSEDRSYASKVERKFFLHDGAYRWLHIVKAGGEWTIFGITVPITLFGDFGLSYSHYTALSDQALSNDGSSHPYQVVNTGEYPTCIDCIATIGFKIYR